MKNKLLLIANIMFALITYSQTSPSDMVAQMGRGINLGNVFSAPVEGNWSPVVYQQYFTDVASAGFTNVRIPIDFFGTRTTGDTSVYSTNSGTSGSYTGTPADYVVSSTYLDRIEEVIDWALLAGLTVTLDFHGQTLKTEFIYTFDTGKSQYTNPTSAKRAADNEKFRTIWSQVADRFKNHADDLLFEIINEPYFSMSAAEMNTINTDILAIIRASGGSNGTRNVIITGGGATSHNAPLQIDSAIISGDSYLIATFHYYQPFSFTSSSGDTRDDESWGTTSDKSTLTTEFDEVLSWATTNSIPVFLGEFGADNTGGYRYNSGDLNIVGSNATGFADGGPDNASRVEYHRYIAEQAINRGFSFAAWDSGPKSNKTIHMRKDNPSTVNYNIANFSVITYNPKNTVISTVIDNSIWIEDVKDALLDTSTSCDNSSKLIVNSNFECGYNSNWDTFASGTNSVGFSDGTMDSRSGNVSAKLVVGSSSTFNSVLLRNQEYTVDLTNKIITIKGYAKVATGSKNIKVRIKAVVNGSNSFTSSPNIGLTTSYPAVPFEFQYTVLPNTTSIQVQIMCGESSGTYYFDDFEFTIVDSGVLTVDEESLKNINLYPNPASNYLTVNSEVQIDKLIIYNMLGKELSELKNSNGNSYDVSELNSGVYFIKIINVKGEVKVKKLVIE